jgi:uncharacterized membrane protein
VTERRLLFAAAAAWAAGFSALSVLRHRAFNTGRFDLGNMVQAVWSTAHSHPLRVTALDGQQISRLASHFDPILAAFAPLWWIWPSPDMLVVAQAAAIAAGAFPVFHLARKHLGSDRAGLGFALAYLLYPATQWLALNEFHPVALACPLLLFAFWYLDEGRLVPFAIFALAACATKEEIGLVVAGLGVWYALARRRWAAGALVAVGGVLVSALAIYVVVPHFNGASSSFYSRYGEVGGSAGGILKTAFTHPLRLGRHAFDAHGLHYLGELVLPLGALCLLAPAALIAALPELALNLLSQNRFQSSIHFHYTGGLIPPLVAAAVFGAARLRRLRPRWATHVPAALVGLGLAANWHLGAVPLWRYVPGGEDLQATYTDVTEHDRVAARAVALVPEGAVVSATNALGAHLSSRRRVLSMPRLGDATWVAADETRPSYLDRNDPVAETAALVRLRRSPRWRLVFEEDGVVLFRRLH